MADDETKADAETADAGLPPASGTERAKWTIFAVVSLLSLIADQATKIWARAALPVEGHGTGAGGVCVIPDDIMVRRCGGVAKNVIEGFWDWRLSMNPGSAFGLFGGQSFARVMLSIVGVAAVGGMIWMLKKSRTDQRVLHWALAFVAGGAVGNLIDRIYYGVVTDFVLWHYKTHEWPVFNVADIVLVVGVGLMFIDIQKEGKREKLLKKARKDQAKAKAKAAGLVKDM
ncbi:MAG: signal peptidase II [Myxococcales bacterium]|nr:signal peptidase II [Myxococcales bacterium]